MTDSKIPPPIPNQKLSFYHQAAKASAWAPAIAIVATIATNVGMQGQGFDPNTLRKSAFIVGLATTGIMLIGLISGIIALFGIPKYGKKGILGKALIGILIPLAFVILAILPSILGAHQHSN